MDGSRRGRGFCRHPQSAGLGPVERKTAGRDSHPRRRSCTAFKRNPEEFSGRTLDSHLLHLTARGVERQCGARIDPTWLSQRLSALRWIRRVAAGRLPAGTKMKKRSAIFSAACIVLVLCGAGCGATCPATMSPASAMKITPNTAPSPSAPEWLAARATNRVADITGAPYFLVGKTVTVGAAVDDVYGPRAFTLDGEGPSLA